MTIGEAIKQANSLCENEYTNGQMVLWLSSLDKLAFKTVFAPADTEARKGTFAGYTEDEDLSRELMIPSPYDDIYVQWLLCKIYLYNQEIELYNNAATVYDNMFLEFSRWWARTHGSKNENIRIKNYRAVT